MNSTSWKRTANTSAPTSATAAPWSATVSNARSTDGAGDPTAPIGTSPTSRTGPTKYCGCGCTQSGSSTTACSSGISPTARSRSGRCPTSSASSRNSRPIRLPTTVRIPEFSRRAEREPVHPQTVAENAPDSAHFEYVHHATVTPRVLDWKIVDHEWQFVAGWPDARSDNPEDLALRFHSHLFGLGGAISVFEGAQNHRLIFTCTPVDDECSDLFYSIWWPRLPGDSLRRTARRTARHHRKAFPVNGLRRSSDLALPEVRGKSRAVQRGRERVYGTA